jgi:hypothetical protein
LQVVTATQEICHLAQLVFGLFVMKVTSKSAFLVLRSVDQSIIFSGRFTQAALRALDWVAKRTLPAEDIPMHQRTGRRGEEAAYFYLRRLGYVMVARNFRSSRRRGKST